MLIRLAVSLVMTLAALASEVGAQDKAVQEAAAQKVPTNAGKAASKALLKRFAAAKKAGDAERLSEVLLAMTAHDNAEFFKVVKGALTYEASRADKKAVEAEADELGMTSASEKKELLAERESLVVAAAARMLGNYPADKAGPVLLKVFKDRDTRKDRPVAAAVIVETLGALGYDKAEKDVRGEFNAFRTPALAKACTRYFGQIKSKDMSTVRTLCEMLSGPQPADVDDPSNPPAAYWAARWKTWSVVRRDVVWSLEQITGQKFQVEDGDREGESAKALKYVRDHSKRLGIK